MKEIMFFNRIYYFFKHNILKSLVWLFAGLAILLCSILLLFTIINHSSSLRQYAISTLEDYVAEMYLIDFSVEDIYFSNLNTIKLNNLLVLDEQSDTLCMLSSGEFQMNLFPFLHREVRLEKLKLQGVTSKLIRGDGEELFNYEKLIPTDSVKKGQEIQEGEKPSGWNFSLHELRLLDIYFLFEDMPGGTQFSYRTDSSYISFSKFDLDKLAFVADNVSTEGSDIYLLSQTPTINKEKKDTVTTPYPDILPRQIDAKKLNFQYENKVTGSVVSLRTEAATILVDTLDLNNRLLNLSQAKLDESMLEYIAWPVDSTIVLSMDTATDSRPELPWEIHAQEAELSHTMLTYHDKSHADGIQAQYIKDIQARLKAVSFHTDQLVKMDLTAFEAQLSELGKFRLSGKMEFSPNRSMIDNFSLQSEKSRMLVNLRADLGWANYEQWQQSHDSLLFSIDDALIVPNEFHAWIPSAYQQSGIDSISAAFKVQGTLQQLQLDPFWIHSNTGSGLEMRGILAANVAQPDFDLQLEKVYIGEKDLRRLLTPFAANATWGNIENLSFQGQISGKEKAYTASLQISGRQNALSLLADIQKDNLNYQYDVKLLAEDFDVRHWLLDDRFPQAFSLQASASGSTDLTTTTAAFEANIPSLAYPNHTFQNIAVEGAYSENDFSFTVESQDEWARMKLAGTLEHATPTIGFRIEGDVDRLELQPFLALADPLGLQANIDIEGSYKTLDEADFHARLDNFLLLKDTIKFSLKEISSSLLLDSQSVDYVLKADSLLFHVRAQSPMSALRDSLQKMLEIPAVSLESIASPPQVVLPSFSVNAQLSQPLELNENMKLGKWKLHTDWNYGTQQLQFVSALDSLQYNSLQFYHLQNNIRGHPKELEFLSSFDSLQMYGIHLPSTELKAKREGQDFFLTLSQQDDMDSLRFMLGTRVRSEENNFRFSLDTSQLRYAYQTMQANDDNYLILDDNKLLGDLDLTWQNGGLSFQSAEDSSGAQLRLHRLSLGNHSDGYTQAIISGDIDLQYDSLSAKGYFLLDSVLFNRHLLPSYALQFSAGLDAVPQFYEVRLGEARLGQAGLGKKSNDELFYVKAYKPDTASLYGNVRLHNLKLGTFQPLLADMLDTLKGTLDGETHWQLDEENLSLDGQLTADNMVIKPHLMDNAFYLTREQITFDQADLLFDNFTIQDPQQNRLIIDGKIELSNLLDPGISLKLKSKNFTLFDIPKNALDFFSGKGLLSSDMSITGTAAHPKITGNLNVDKGTTIRYVAEGEAFEYQQEDDVLVFKNEEATLPKNQAAKNPGADLMNKLSLNLNVDVEPSVSALMILTEKPRNDARISGGGNFTLQKSPGDEIKVNGTYTLNKGEIQIVTPFLISRQLKLKEDSRIIFNDNPYNPRMDITMEYNTYASASALFPSESNVASSMAFDVVIDVKNSLEDPTLSFDLHVNDTDVQNTLNTFSKEERDKQALNLLLFNSFFIEGGEGSGFSARTEAEMMVANQLNRLANEKIKGVDINFSYENSTATDPSGSFSDESDLSYELSKQINDRLRLKLGGYVNPNNNNNRSENLIGDIILEYYLDEKKKNYLKIFRQNSYESFFEGDVDVSGIGIVFEKNYRKLKDVLKGRKDD